MLHRHAISDTRVLFHERTVGKGASRFYGCQPEGISNTGYWGSRLQPRH